MKISREICERKEKTTKKWNLLCLRRRSLLKLELMTVVINPALFDGLGAKVTVGKDIVVLLVAVFVWLVGWVVVGSASSAETRCVVEGVCLLSGGAPTHKMSEYFRHALDCKFVD